MNKEIIIQKWKEIRDVLNKKNITDEYIEKNVCKFNCNTWDIGIIDEIFDEILVSEPTKANISAQEIKNRYWQKWKEKQKDIQTENITPCLHGLCNGEGVIRAIIPAHTKIKMQNSITFNCPIDYETYFACDCIKGQTQTHFTKWATRNKDINFIIDYDYAYTATKFEQDKKNNDKNLDKEKSVFIKKILEYVSGGKKITKDNCKYDQRVDWQKELLDEYFKGKDDYISLPDWAL